jgi:long-chain acyl-CoA synthetase
VDEVGELVARGSNLMTGYYHDADETARVLDARGYHTGDLARRDARGLLYVVGRKKDMIKSGGHRIAAKEIEDAILEHGEVHETAVIGVPDEILGEQIKAVVVLRRPDAVDGKGLARFLSERLPQYKIPQIFDFRAELPKNESGKIMKQVLRAEVAGE